MRRDYGVEEWLPGGIALRAPVAAAVDAETNRAGVDLNEVDFDGLIALGLSVGQAARFISQRERRGGITQLADLDRFHGITPGVRDILRRSGHV